MFKRSVFNKFNNHLEDRVKGFRDDYKSIDACLRVMEYMCDRYGFYPAENEEEALAFAAKKSDFFMAFEKKNLLRARDAAIPKMLESFAYYGTYAPYLRDLDRVIEMCEKATELMHEDTIAYANSSAIEVPGRVHSARLIREPETEKAYIDAYRELCALNKQTGCWSMAPGNVVQQAIHVSEEADNGDLFGAVNQAVKELKTAHAMLSAQSADEYLSRTPKAKAMLERYKCVKRRPHAKLR